MPERTNERTRARWMAWIMTRWRPLAVAAVTLPLVVVAVTCSLYWPGRPFPGFFLFGNLLVPTVGRYEWTGPKNDLSFHSRITAVNGQPVRTMRAVYETAARASEERGIGAPVRYRVAKGNAPERSIEIPTMQFGWADFWLTCGLFLVNGLLVVIAGIVVNLLQPDTEEARVFLAFGWFSGLIMLTAPPLYHPDWSAWAVPFNALAYACWGASFVHLGLVFPIKHPLLVRHPTIWVLPYLVSVVLTVWIWLGVYAEPPDLTPLYLAMDFTALGIAAMVLLFVLAYRRDPTPLTRRRLRIILPFFVLSIALCFFAMLDNSRGGGSFPVNLSTFSVAFFYIGIGYAIVRHDLFEIDRFVKLAAVYVTLSIGVTAAYALSLVLVGRLSSNPNPTLFNILFVIAAAIAFEPARRRVQILLDRSFFRAQVDYRQTIGEVSNALTSLLDLDEILTRIARPVDAGLAPDGLAVVLWLEDGARLWRRAASGELLAAPSRPTEALRTHLERSPERSWRVPRAGTTSTTEEEAARSEAAALGGALALPLRRHERVLGALILGRRRSGLPYTSSDRDLLETLAAQSAIALQNALLFGEVRELNQELEAKVEKRTGELAASNQQLSRAYRDLQDTQAQLLHTEKMASLGQLVAGMAHEINTPVTAVVGNVKPLANELGRLRDRAAVFGDDTLDQIARRMGAILEVMARGAERTAGIVQDLRVFSRPGEMRTLPIDVHDGIEATLRLLRPRWTDRIEIHRDFGAPRPLEAAAGPINQVFMNLLGNACDAIVGSGNIWIQTRFDDASARISIRDDGCGIPAEQLGRVFDPFFTTKEIGKGTGLGLAISSSIVREHGGRIEVSSEPARGTTFTVFLPLRPAAQANGATALEPSGRQVEETIEAPRRDKPSMA